jgi:hypothetical protein
LIIPSYLIDTNTDARDPFTLCRTVPIPEGWCALGGRQVEEVTPIAFFSNSCAAHLILQHIYSPAGEPCTQAVQLSEKVLGFDMPIRQLCI